MLTAIELKKRYIHYYMNATKKDNYRTPKITKNEAEFMSQVDKLCYKGNTTRDLCLKDLKIPVSTPYNEHKAVLDKFDNDMDKARQYVGIMGNKSRAKIMQAFDTHKEHLNNILK